MNKSDLNIGQLSIIKLLYRYRYGSIDLLRDSLDMKHNSGLYQKLEVLIKHGYVGKHYKKDYRLIGFPAAYHLLPKAYRLLSRLEGYSVPEALIKASYRDTTRSTAFISHFLDVYGATRQLTRVYPMIKAYSQRDLMQYDTFPARLPDSYLSLRVGAATHRYFLDIIPTGTPRYVIEKLVSDYHEFFLGDTWEETGSDLPTLLILTDSGKTEKYLQRLIRNKQDALDMAEPLFYTSTLGALKNSSPASNRIWSEAAEPDELLSLPDL